MATLTNQTNRSELIQQYAEEFSHHYVGHDLTWMPSKIEECGCDDCQDHILRERAIERKDSASEIVTSLKTGVFGYCSSCRESIPSVSDYIDAKIPQMVKWEGGEPFQGFVRYTLHLNCHTYLADKIPDGQFQSLVHQIEGGASARRVGSGKGKSNKTKSRAPKGQSKKVVTREDLDQRLETGEE